MSDPDQLEQRLGELRYEHDAVANTRTKEDVRAVAESWLAAAVARTGGSTAGLVINQHANPEHVQAVLAEFLLDAPGILDFIVKRVEATTELTNRARDSKLRKLSTEIAEVEKQHLEARKKAALEQLEREFAGEAA